MRVPIVSVTDVQALFDPLFEEAPTGGVVFDADGTLWAHDVGCLVFEEAVRERAFRDEAREALYAHAVGEGLVLPESLSASQIGEKIVSAYRAGKYGERSTAELQVWAYVGDSESDLRELSRRALGRAAHDAGFHTDVVELLSWIRERGIGAFVVSASPRIVVEEATRALDFTPEEIAAGDPIWAGGRIAPGLAHPLPYGPDKVVAGRRLLAGAPWLGTFGDSAFDLEMMQEARLAVAIGDKPALLRGLVAVEGAVRLKLST